MINKDSVRYFFCLFILILASHVVWAQHDADSLVNILEVWNLSEEFEEIKKEAPDTGIEQFHLTPKEYEQSFQFNNLGNLASAYLPVQFFKRTDQFSEKFSFNIPYEIYIKKSENVNYYNTRKPYTSIFHTTSTKIKDIQTIALIHTQNINPNVNFGVNYDFISSAGEYSEQISKINSVSLTGNVSKNRYTAYIAYIFNKFNFQNSGGYEPVTVGIEEVITPFLKNSTTTLLNQEFTFTQKYKFGQYKNITYKDSIIKILEPSVSLSYNLSLERKYRIYRDQEDESGKKYTIFNFQQESTFDSVGYRALINNIRLGSEEVFEKNRKFGFDLTLESNYYQLFNFKGYILQNNKDLFFENALTGSLRFNLFKMLSVNIYSDFYISGYRKNDHTGEILLSKNLYKKLPKSEVKLKAAYLNKKPDFFFMNYYSNHQIWNNSFDNIQKLDLSLSLNIPEYKLYAELNAAFINNYIWFGSVKLPQQFTSGINVFSLYLEKDFRLKIVNFDNKINIQNTSEPDIISLPILAVYHSGYFKFLIRNSLLLYPGYDISYATSSKAMSYDPSNGHFYLENQNLTTGNYPYIGVFVNAKIKKNVYLFVHFSHINSGFFENMDPVGIKDYPVYDRLYKFGVKWTFKN